jgi:hypothetical protein
MIKYNNCCKNLERNKMLCKDDVASIVENIKKENLTKSELSLVASGKLALMKTYRIAATVDGLVGKNSGNAVGDNSYISGEFCGRHPTECDTAILTQYTVLYNPKYLGNYTFCNPGGYLNGTGEYKCSCDPHKYVKCDDVNTIGIEEARLAGVKGAYWFSWPIDTYCSSDNELSDTSNCYWKIVGKPKSVTIKQLKDAGYKYVKNSDYVKWDNDGTLTDNLEQFVAQNSDKNVKIIDSLFHNLIE